MSRVARFGSRRTTVLASTEAGEEKKVYIKNQRNDLQKKKNFLRGASVFKDVKGMVDDDMKQQFSSDLVGEMQDSPNYVLEKDGFEFHLAKDFGFCWGVERSINLAYSAVETFPDSKLHITNELIHNPQVNGHLKYVVGNQKTKAKRDGTARLPRPSFFLSPSQPSRNCSLVRSRTAGLVTTTHDTSPPSVIPLIFFAPGRRT